MTRLSIYKLLPRRALTARSSAREISQEVRDALNLGGGELEFGFQDILGFSPSFFDELIAVVGDGTQASGQPASKIIITSPPVPLTPKYDTICRGRGFKISEHSDGQWLIVKS
jgi:hypothetical protein